MSRADALTMWRYYFAAGPWRRARDRYLRLRPIAPRRCRRHIRIGVR